MKTNSFCIQVAEEMHRQESALSDDPARHLLAMQMMLGTAVEAWSEGETASFQRALMLLAAVAGSAFNTAQTLASPRPCCEECADDDETQLPLALRFKPADLFPVDPKRVAMHEALAAEGSNRKFWARRVSGEVIVSVVEPTMTDTTREKWIVLNVADYGTAKSLAETLLPE